MQKKKIPEPVLYDLITFYDGDNLIKYTDCWEISLLRFLHLIFGNEGAIEHETLIKLMNTESKYCQALIAYFKDNPTYYFDE